jgi:hypothetical protein
MTGNDIPTSVVYHLIDVMRVQISQLPISKHKLALTKILDRWTSRQGNIVFFPKVKHSLLGPVKELLMGILFPFYPVFDLFPLVICFDPRRTLVQFCITGKTE